MRKTDWRSALLWIGCFVLTLVVMGWVTRQESDRQLEQDAAQSALRWSGLLGQTVPDLDILFTTGTLSAAARDRLTSLPKDDDTVLFELFNPRGALVLSSNDLKNAAQPGLGRDTAAVAARATDADPAQIRSQVMTGMHHVVLRRDGQPDRPAVYSEVYVPVRQEGKLLGVAQIYLDQTTKAASAAQGLMRIAAVVSILLMVIAGLAAYQHAAGRRSRREAEEERRYLARHDALSGALNRASFNEVLARAAAQAKGPAGTFSLLRIDLDRFKEVNDALGHDLGDEVLRLVTLRLRTCLRKDDQLARLEGDEFAILLKGAATTQAVTPIAKQILQALADPFELSGHTVRSGGSIGIAMHGSDATGPDELMTMADLALFRAKASGRGIYVFHDADLDRARQSSRDLTRDLRTALEADQLSIHYQPLFAIDAQLLVGYEALLRWQHPVRGNVPPAEFVPLAEAAGLIDEIGLWVLRRACKDAGGWPSPLSVAVNLSVKQFASGRLVRQVARALADSGLPAERLGLEITESLLMHNSEQVMRTLRNLGALGVSITMDDFGTGYSSLAYLWRFPFDKVKIDQVFTKHMVSDPKVGMIVRSIIALAHSLGMRVNAEGVETGEQVQALQQLGCDELQGFLLGLPGPAKSLTHAGHLAGRDPEKPRGEARESLFATLAMDLPPVESAH